VGKPSRPRLKLQFALVPQPLHFENLRAADRMGKQRWTTFRRNLIKAGHNRCVVCASAEKLNAHEVWKYIDRESVAKLVRIDMVCRKCHDVMHWGSTTRLVAEGKFKPGSIAALKKHFRTVNQCRQVEFDRCLARHEGVWRKRSLRKWRVDWGQFETEIVKAEIGRQTWAALRLPSPHDNADFYPLSRDRDIPSACPHCGAAGTLRSIPQNIEAMGESEEADYEQGTWGVAMCQACKSEVSWGF
jgi:hypothetical protein